MTSYLELKRQHQEEVDNFPIRFAFNQHQFEEGMAELGLTPADTDKIYSIGAGGFIRKSDGDAFGAMFARHREEMRAAVDADETGDGFLYEMFDYELGNHEYIVTLSPQETLDALDLTEEMVNADPKLRHALDKAIRAQHARYPDGV